MLSPLLYTGLGVSGVTALARRVRNAGVILCYHNVVSSADASPGGTPGAHMPAERFHRHMRWLVAHYDVLPLSAFLDRASRGAPMRRVASVTFDDAYAGMFEHAWPVLRELGVIPTVFVIAGAPGRTQWFWWDRPAVVRASDDRRRREWLTTLRGDEDAVRHAVPEPAGGEAAPSRAYLAAPWSVIREAARTGMEVGVHSATHRALPALDDHDLVDEIQASRAVIARETGTAPGVFAFPYGLWDKRVRRQVQEAGYQAALTLDYGLVAAGADRWALPRVNVPSGMSDPAYRAWAAGLNARYVLRR
jgi:peptidoglycan/xylan/chitin deacetylase (PgdA/CDA1 family)